MRRFAMLSAGILSALALAAPASFAKQPTGYYDSHHVWHSYQHSLTRAERLKCERARQNASNRGAVLGALGGAVIGSAVAGKGAKTEGAVIGGVGGVLTGRQLAKKNHRC
jgi:outer membrane lipoprotein SlyB